MPRKRKQPLKPPGRPRTELSPKDLRQLEILAGLGLTWPQIALLLEVPKSTLLERRNDTEAVSDAYERGRARADMGVGQALYKKATGGDVAAIRWYEMTRAGRREGLSLAGRPDDDPETPNASFLPIEIRFIDP